MFKCKVCAEKDARIADLKSEITYLRERRYGTLHADVVSAEQDLLLNGGADIPQLTEQDRKEQKRLQDEAISLLSGTY